MPIETNCPGCKRLLRVDEQYAGRQARCPLCSTIYTVPAFAAPAYSASAQAESVFAAAGVAGMGALDATGERQHSSEVSSTAEATSAFGAAESPGDNPAQWWLKTPEGKSYGPVGKTELDQWMAEGRITADCALRCGEAAWEPADRVYANLREPPRSDITYLGTRGVSAGSTPQPNYGPASYGAASYGASNPYAASTMYPVSASPHAYGRRAYQQPHRGMTILMLALVGWVVGCPVLGIVAWVMASADLREIRSGRMDPEGLGLTQAGQILGAIHSIMLIGIFVLMFLFVFASAAFGAV